MKNVFILLLLAVIPGSIPAQARLGETEQQIIARYGTNYTAKTNEVSRELWFHWGERIVTVGFLRGKSVSEYVYPAPPDLEEARLIRDGISAGSKWEAVITNIGRGILVETVEYHKLLAASAERKRKEKVEGF